MKRFRTLVPLVGLLLGIAWDAAQAQDPVKVAPGNYKVTLDNSRVRVLDIHIKPGEKVAMQ